MEKKNIVFSTSKIGWAYNGTGPTPKSSTSTAATGKTLSLTTTDKKKAAVAYTTDKQAAGKHNCCEKWYIDAIGHLF